MSSRGPMMQGVLGNVVLSGQPPPTDNPTLWKGEHDSLDTGFHLCHHPSLSPVPFAGAVGAWASFSADFLTWLCLALCSRISCLFSHVEWCCPWGLLALCGETHTQVPIGCPLCMHFLHCCGCPSDSEKCMRRIYLPSWFRKCPGGLLQAWVLLGNLENQPDCSTGCVWSLLS